MQIEVMGVAFHDVTLDEAAHIASGFMEDGGFHYVVTPNPEIVTLATKDASFRDIIQRADLVLPDGIGVIYASRILGRPLRERVPGIDFATRLMGGMARRGQRLFLLGARPGVAEAAARALSDAYPGLVLCGTCDGYFEADAPVVSAIRAAGADVVFVCLGAPKQEKWMARFGPETGARLMVGLGGALDVFSGEVQRAPARWQRLGLEWLFRLKQEPGRVSRMAKLPLFLVRALGRRLAEVRPARKTP